MSKETREFFEKLENAAVPEVGAAQVMGKLWDALTPAFELGAEEITRAMFTGHGYVFHGDTIPEEMQQAPPIEPMHRQEERGGLEI